MSLGGQEDSAAVIVYGPDGKAYGSPAQARAAGVESATMSPPPGAPASAPGAYSAPTLDFSTPNIVYAPPMAGPAPAPYNPMGQASLGVVVYGPDGKAYGSPLDARNAGVSNPTMSPPADVPISYPGRQPYTPAPLPSIPTQSSGGRNRYAEIMANYQQAQPFSFTGMPPSYTGGFTGYPSDYTGGFTPYTPQPAAPVTRYEEIMAQPAMGGGGRGMQEASEPRYNPLSPLASPELGSPGFQFLDAYGRTIVLPLAIPSYLKSQSMLTSQLEQAGINAAKAFADAQAGYAAGTMFGAPPSDASTFAGGGFGPIRTQTTPTGAGIAANPMSVDPAQAMAARDALAAQAQAAREQAGREAARQVEAQMAAQAQAQADASAAAAAQDAAQNYSNEGRNYGGGGRSGDGGGVATGGNNGDASGGGDRGTRGGFAQGGHVSMMHLQGPNPEGPDDGYAALKDGEFVINDKAVKKYGIELMNLINSGKISKGKLRGLLEM